MNGQLAKALLLSVAIHFTLALALLLGDFSSTPPKPKPTAMQIQSIKAVVIAKSDIEDQLNKLKKQKSDAAKRIKQKKDQAEAAKRKKSKEKARLKKQRKKKEHDKKVAQDNAKKAKAADRLRKKKAAEKKRKDKASADKAKRLKAAKKAKDAEKLRKKKAADKKRKEKSAKDRALQENMLAEQMAEEMATRQKARKQQMMTEIGRYTALITRTIQSNLITDQASMENKSCKLTIKLAPSGFVITVISGKGDSIVCDAASKAVYKAGKLPVSKDPEVFEKMRTISLTVVPEF